MGLVFEILLIIGLIIGLIINLIAESVNKLVNKLVIKRITNELITRQGRSPRNRISGAAPRTHPPQQHRQPDRPP